MNPDLISVIIPAYNAEATLAATIQSVLEQTHKAIEVLVVDDGSHDGTARLAGSFADGRVRLISIANSGVANARNVGIAASEGSYIAPLDADDLWHPHKLELQLARMKQAGSATGVVYNWFRCIDGTDHVTGRAPMPRVEGYVLHRHLDWNFISNGSTPLIRRTALGELRYETALHQARNQGCEDYLLQLQLSQRTQFALVPAFLTGYRRLAGSMSTDAAKMIRSHIQVFETLRPALPATARKIVDRRLAQFHIEYARNRARRAHPAAAGAAAVSALRYAPGTALAQAVREICKAATSRPGTRQSSSAPTWSLQDPFDGRGLEIPDERLRRLEKLAVFDSANVHPE